MLVVKKDFDEFDIIRASTPLSPIRFQGKKKPMKRRLILEFTKMHGAGNDFIVLDNRFYAFPEEKLSELAKQYCDRRLGIGADGLLALNEFDDDDPSGLDFQMRYFNADGSLGLMCGNGARVLSQFAYRSGIQKPVLTFETSAGVYRSEVADDPKVPVKLYMPDFKDFRPNIAVESELSDAVGSVHYIFTGTQHAVCFVSNLDAFDAEAWGYRLRWHEVFKPHGVNANFVEVQDQGMDTGLAKLKIRTFEKGVEAETLACGTGALAAAVVARMQGHIEANTVQLFPRGGQIDVGFEFESGIPKALWQAGPTATVYRGSLEL